MLTSTDPAGAVADGPAADVAPLQVTDARRLYDGERGIRGLDLTLARGELYVLLGPNGAGKTSLIRAICGRLTLDAGSVQVEGRDPFGDRGALRHLGLVPQQVALYPELTARENLSLFARVSGLDRAASTRAVEQALARAGLEDRGSSLVHTLSGGMQRRLHLVAGVMHEPSVVVLDEPTVGVDPDARARLHELLLSMKQEGTALLMTTHDLDEARSLADRIGILIDGTLRAEGTPAELVRSVFGDARAIEIVLESAPDDEGRAILADEGLSPDADELRWSGELHGSLEQLVGTEERLRQARLALSELRIREPSLSSVYFRMTGSDE